MNIKLWLSLIVVVELTACGSMVDRRDAPWDPRPGQALFEQLPAWHNAAQQRCGAHLRPQQRTQGMTDRC